MGATKKLREKTTIKDITKQPYWESNYLCMCVRWDQEKERNIKGTTHVPVE